MADLKLIDPQEPVALPSCAARLGASRDWLAQPAGFGLRA